MPPPAPSRDDGTRSLAEVHGTVAIPATGPWWRRWLAVAGPALMVSVGYMDPGNWATDLAAGSRFEYRLLWVLLMSNAMAVLLQGLSARLGLVARRDLAQASRDTYPAVVNGALYGLAEIAIAACDLAEVLGSAIALQLLFGLPLLAGVVITTLDVLLLLALTRFGIRKLEAVILTLVGTIGAAFLVEVLLARPAWGGVAHGFIPALPGPGALYIAIGILGATVMPHNLYLHSALVQTRRFGRDEHELRRAVRLNATDSALALNVAFFVNAAILIMAAAVFHRSGHHDVVEIKDAHQLLEPIVGAAIAPVLFAIALLAAGQSSTVTGTLAGQIVMEGHLNFRVRPWLRRMLTRVFAVLPAVLTIVLAGEGATGELLVASQVVLSLQLPFAAIPLIHFVSDRRRMGNLVIGRWTRAAAWLVAVVIVALNAGLVVQQVRSWIDGAGRHGTLVALLVLPVAAGIALLLAYVAAQPLLARLGLAGAAAGAGDGIHAPDAVQEVRLTQPEPFRRVAIALDFNGREEKLLAESLRILGPSRPRLCLLHVVESATALAFGGLAADREADADAARLAAFASRLGELGFEVETALGTGAPVSELARMVEAFGADLLILGGHGHRGLRDVLHGSTADRLRHRVTASVLVVPLA